MTCKPLINAINTASQILLINGLVEFANAPIDTGCGIEFISGSNAFTINRAGYYHVSVDVDVEPTTSGLIGVQLLNNGVVVPGAVSTFTGTVDTVEHVHVQTIVKVLTSCKCVNNNAVLQVQIIDGAATVTNPNIAIEAVKM